MQEREHKNGLILGLLAQCLVRSSGQYCPLSHLAGLHLDEQIARVEKLSDFEVAEIMAHHQDCEENYSRMVP